MGLTKRLMELQEAQCEEATNIAVEAGCLEQCEYHSDMVWETFEDPAEAYKIGNARFTANELQTEFRSRRELTDAIKEAIEEAGIDGCSICTKVLED